MFVINVYRSFVFSFTPTTTGSVFSLDKTGTTCHQGRCTPLPGLHCSPACRDSSPPCFSLIELLLCCKYLAPEHRNWLYKVRPNLSNFVEIFQIPAVGQVSPGGPWDSLRLPDHRPDEPRWNPYGGLPRQLLKVSVKHINYSAMRSDSQIEIERALSVNKIKWALLESFWLFISSTS